MMFVFKWIVSECYLTGIAKVVASNPLGSFFIPSFGNTLPCRSTIKSPTMAFYQSYGICMSIIFYFSIEYITIQYNHGTSVSYKVFQIIVFSLCDIFLMSNYYDIIGVISTKNISCIATNTIIIIIIVFKNGCIIHISISQYSNIGSR